MLQATDLAKTSYADQELSKIWQVDNDIVQNTAQLCEFILTRQKTLFRTNRDRKTSMGTRSLVHQVKWKANAIRNGVKIFFEQPNTRDPMKLILDSSFKQNRMYNAVGSDTF